MTSVAVLFIHGVFVFLERDRIVSDGIGLAQTGGNKASELRLEIEHR